MKILVTGFDPFENEPINPAIEVVKRLPDTIYGAQIIKLEIPTEFKRSGEKVHEAIKKYQPDYVLDVGQAGGQIGLTPEKVAVNIDDGSVPDNAGYRPMDKPIAKDGETAYLSQLPVKAMVKAIRDAGLPACLSMTAGTYVCNHVMYAVQYMRDKEFPHLKAGFIHIPYIPSQTKNKPKGTPSLTLQQNVKGVTAAIKAIVKFDGKPDLKDIGNAYHYNKVNK